MKHARSSALALALCLFSAAAWASVAPTSEAAQREQTRKELNAFFNGLSESTPGALGTIRKSPETMKAVRNRIAGMSDGEVAEFHQLMTEVPDWKSAPQTLAKLLPPETLKKLQADGADFTARVPQAEKMRDDVRTLVTALKLLPETKLQEIGVDRKKLDDIDQSLQQLTPLQIAVLQKQLTQAGGWETQGAAALNAMPPELQKGAAALAKHGPITALDVVELEKYRARLIDVLNRVTALPEESRKSLNVDTLRAQAAQLPSARPDVLYMLREQVTPEMLAQLSEKLAILERAANLTPAERDQLEHFRADLVDAYSRIAPDQAKKIQESLGSLGPEHLMLLQQKFAGFDQWQVIMPAYYQALQSPGFADHIAALQGPSPDPSRIADLETFRQDALHYIDASAGSVESTVAANARRVIENASLPKLEFIRATAQAMPPSASATAKLQMVSNIDLNFDCVVHTPDPLPNIDLNFICNPIKDAINGVVNSLQSAINTVQSTLTNTINTIRDGLQSAINSITDTINTIVSNIISTVNTIWSFVQTIPTLAWNAIKSALNLLLDLDLGHGITIRGLISDGLATTVPKLQAALNLAGNWWTALGSVELPLIPCPDAGIHTPFGTVGDGAAVTKYNRYKFFIDKIIGLIPDTETSLEIKIPAQVLYAAFDYLGVCLQDAANDANDQLLTNRHTEITTNQTLLGQQLALSFTNLSNLSNSNNAGLSTQITSTSNTLQALIMSTSNTVQSLLNTSTNNLTTLINNKSLDLTNLINHRSDDQRDLDLRMQIELNLQAGEGKALAAFQLPKANGGYLELARDLVNNAINATLATGQSVGQAQKWFAQAQTDFSAGKFKNSYSDLQKAYNELTK